jgi:sugar (pentulose or hexulose) kinase
MALPPRKQLSGVNMKKSLRYGILTATAAALLGLGPGIVLAAGHPNAPTVGQEANQLNSNGSTEAGTTGMNSEQRTKPTDSEASNQATNETNKPFKNGTMQGQATNELNGQVVKGNGSSTTTEPSGAHPSR